MSSGDQYDVGYTSSLDVGGKVLTVAVAVIITLVLFILCFQIFSRCLNRGLTGESQRLRGSHRGDRDPARLHPVGLQKSVIESLPVFVYQSAEHRDRLECAVCLSEFEEKDKARLLPNCNHTFHVDCIDMWFHSHSTCPLCRSPVRPDAPSTVVVVGEASSSSDGESPSAVGVNGSPSEQRGETASAAVENDGLPSPTLVTNVLFWGTREQMSSRFNPFNVDDQGTSSPKALGKIAIDIPKIPDGFSSPRLFTSYQPQEVSPSGPSSKSRTTRLRSLKRLLSRGKEGLSQSPSAVDVERALQCQAEA